MSWQKNNNNNFILFSLPYNNLQYQIIPTVVTTTIMVHEHVEHHFTFVISFNPHIYPVKKGTMGNPNFTNKKTGSGRESPHIIHRRSQDSDPDYELKAWTQSMNSQSLHSIISENILFFFYFQRIVTLIYPIAKCNPKQPYPHKSFYPFLTYHFFSILSHETPIYTNILYNW